MIENLNPGQRDAVLNTDGPVMVLAGAGSGKTRTLVTRIQYLLDEKQVSPFQVLAVTFSNKAAKEMRERVASSSQIDVGALQITTFHAFCAKVLRTEANYLGLSRNFTIYDQTESRSVIKNILGKHGIKQKEISPHEVQYYIDELKNLGHYLNSQGEEIEDIDTSDQFYGFFKEYEAEIHKCNAVDFGSLITGVLCLFDNYPEVLERYQKRFKYILVDEYQDTNRAQFRLIKLLSEKVRNVCVVGDEDQSIYSWRGADIRNILDFETVFPDAKLIKLEQNYRSSKNIIDAATAVISQNKMRKGKNMWTDNHEGESIRVLECSDDRSEAEFIGQEVQSLVSDGVSPQDIAVFYRTNAQSRILEDSLRQLRIPYKVVAGIKFYERKEIKDLLAYLRIIVNDKDSLALSRIINVPVRGIGARSLRKLEDEAIKLQVSLWEFLVQYCDNPSEFSHLRLSNKIKQGLNQFVSVIQECMLMDKNLIAPSEIYEKILHESGYYESLATERTHEAHARIENLDELLSAIKQFEDINKNATLLGFLETITLDSNKDENNIDGEVSLMTIHGAKGLEYPYVFVAGIEETVFPSYQSMENGEEAIEEERRLFYVAMTRAMKRLYLLFAQGRMLWGSVKFNGPSRFLMEVPEAYYTWETYKTNKSNAPSYASDDIDYSDEFSQESFTKEEPKKTTTKKKLKTDFEIDILKPEYPQGCMVKHQLYGEGVVITSDGIGQNEKVTIQFNDGMKKKFMVKFAPLEHL
jgi:DNA helicase-2/ATP-dependent DNA helicase PcrA